MWLLRSIFTSFVLQELFLQAQAYTNSDAGQQPLLGIKEDSDVVHRVAIIGAGAAGSSAAYHLRKLSANTGHAVNITIFETRPYIGGRSTIVHAYEHEKHPVELGASIFVQVNTILVEAAKEFGLEVDGLTSSGTYLPQRTLNNDVEEQDAAPGVGIWNGDEFVFTQATDGESEGLSWWDIAKLVWKYGTTPLWVQREMKTSVNKFLGMYDPALNFPWDDLTTEIQRRGLLENAGFTAEQYLRNKRLWGNGKFVTEIVQAATRVNYAQNLGVISGMESMVSIATDGAMAIRGGNWRIFDGMVRSSGADVRLNTTVTSITPLKDGGLSLTTKSESSGVQSKDSFDKVIIASPWQFTGLDVPSSLLGAEPDTIPYVHLHVTLFTSPHPLSPLAFNLPEDSLAPRVVLTTLASPDPDAPLPSKPTFAGKPGFFSISRLRTIKHPSTNRTENLYKIFTPKPVEPKFLHGILGLSGEVPKSVDDISSQDITWMHLKEWQSYPVEFPRATFDRIKLGDGLFYTGAMDPFISAMESNALMGKNVAALVIDEWISGKK